MCYKAYSYVLAYDILFQLKLDLSDTDGGAVSDSRSGSFVIYNCARLATLFSHFQKAVHTGSYRF